MAVAIVREVEDLTRHRRQLLGNNLRTTDHHHAVLIRSAACHRYIVSGLVTVVSNHTSEG
ncbi:MAG: hypothetical protein JWN15_3731, partial [Firmicutes bacterium]|nr:hypothetical protein [Bacillota bacterium]